MSNSKDRNGMEKAKFFENFEQIRCLHCECEMSFRKIARRLWMNYSTVYKYYNLVKNYELRNKNNKTMKKLIETFSAFWEWFFTSKKVAAAQLIIAGLFLGGFIAVNLIRFIERM